MKQAFVYLVSTILFNTAIAGLLSIGHPVELFWNSFFYSQCIGLSVLVVNGTVVHRITRSIMRWGVLLITLPVSVACGLTVAFFLSGTKGWNGPYIGVNMLLGLFFGLIGCVTLLLYRQVELEMKKRHLVQAESEKREIEAHLKLLQAQIEPHFLFNTLANVDSLIESDPALAKQLLERLNGWLRVALLRTRDQQITLGEELEMLENYLQILQIRFGDRLQWMITVSEEMRLIRFPPMLLQPLVENAVRHGLEPKVGGGEIRICSQVNRSTLRIEVSDTGIGLQENMKSGAGLENVRARLHALFGTSGHLLVQHKAEGGVCAILELPL